MKGDRDQPGAVILDGGHSGVVAARNLAAQGVRAWVFAGATTVARFSRSVSGFAHWPRGIPADDLPAQLAAMADRHHLRGSVLFPIDDEHLRAVAQQRQRLAAHFVFTHPSWETIRILYDKRLTCRLALEAGVPMPRTHLPGGAGGCAALEVEFPVVLKPAISSRFARFTQQKAYRVDDRRRLRECFEQMAQTIGPAEVMVQELVPGPAKNLYSFAGYFRNGEPVAGVAARRPRQWPSDFGWFSTLVETVDVPDLRELAGRLLRVIRYTGLAEVEFMWNERRARFELLEVNPRLWAWHGLAIAAGLDLPYLAYADAIGKTPPRPAPPRAAKWIMPRADLRVAARGLWARELGVGQYLASLRGRKTWALFSWSDPWPSVAKPLLGLGARLRRLLSPSAGRRPGRVGPEVGAGGRAAEFPQPSTPSNP